MTRGQGDGSAVLRTADQNREKKEVPDYEDDISAKEEIQSESAWLQSENENCGRKKSISCKKSKRKKSIVSVSPSEIIAGGFLYLLFA